MASHKRKHSDDELLDMNKKPKLAAQPSNDSRPPVPVPRLAYPYQESVPPTIEDLQRRHYIELHGTLPIPSGFQQVGNMVVPHIQSVLTWSLNNLCCYRPLSGAEKPAQAISMFIDSACPGVPYSCKSLDFSFDWRSDSDFYFIMEAGYDHLSAAELPTTHAGLRMEDIPEEIKTVSLGCHSKCPYTLTILQWPLVPHHLIVLPNIVQGLDLNKVVDLVNRQVEYWSHEIFYTKAVDSIDKGRKWGQLRLYRLCYWMRISGKNRFWQWCHHDRSRMYRGRTMCQLFEEFLGETKMALDEELAQFAV